MTEVLVGHGFLDQNNFSNERRFLWGNVVLLREVVQPSHFGKIVGQTRTSSHFVRSDVQTSLFQLVSLVSLKPCRYKVNVGKAFCLSLIKEYN